MRNKPLIDLYYRISLSHKEIDQVKAKEMSWGSNFKILDTKICDLYKTDCSEVAP